MKQDISRCRDGRVNLALHLLERTQLSRSREAGQFIPNVASNANGTCEQRIEVADSDVLGEVFDTSDGRADFFDSVWTVLCGWMLARSPIVVSFAGLLVENVWYKTRYGWLSRRHC